ncbi:hypothetical protein Plhal304r1_c029g0096201 [Plasmopara halstedii]
MCRSSLDTISLSISIFKSGIQQQRTGSSLTKKTKPKAYDYYYNVAVKSDYGKGAKLKVMIQEQALDDACSDSIANLFPQVMGKNCEYRYDQITEKLTKRLLN